MEKLGNTEHLNCFMALNDENRREYFIFEKGAKTPFMQFGGNGKLTHISNTIPLLIEDYKYYNEVKDIVKDVIKFDKVMGAK